MEVEKYEKQTVIIDYTHGGTLDMVKHRRKLLTPSKKPIQKKPPIVRIYAVVTPNPKDGHRLQFLDGTRRMRPYWWFKLGDGEFRSAYATHNPDHLGIQNTVCSDATVGILNHEMQHQDVRLAKGLEWEILKTEAGSRGHGEWYRIWAKNENNDNQVAPRLITFLAGFRRSTENQIRTALNRLFEICYCQSKGDDNVNVREKWISEPSIRFKNPRAYGKPQGDPGHFFYLAVFPNPFRNLRRLCETNTTNLRRCWWFKIGDGFYRSAYATHNPEVIGNENGNSEYSLAGITDNQGNYGVRRIGKALELEVLKEPSGNGFHTEWYKIYARNPDDDEALQEHLQDILGRLAVWSVEQVHAGLKLILDACDIENRDPLDIDASGGEMVNV